MSAQQRAALRGTYVDADEVAMRRAMQRIGGDDTSRRTGQSFSEANRARVRARLEEQRARGIKQPTPMEEESRLKREASTYKSNSQRAVAVPRVGVGVRRPMPPAVAFLPHRKTLEEIRAEHDGFERDRAPAYVPTISNEQRKDELATRNQFNGRTPAEVLGGAPAQAAPRRRAAAADAARAAAAAKPHAEQAQALRDEIADEIAERQAFLQDMVSLGQGEEHEPQMRLEIAERLRDLKALDALAADETPS